MHTFRDRKQRCLLLLKCTLTWKLSPDLKRQCGFIGLFLNSVFLFIRCLFLVWKHNLCREIQSFVVVLKWYHLAFFVFFFLLRNFSGLVIWIRIYCGVRGDKNPNLLKLQKTLLKTVLRDKLKRRQNITLHGEDVTNSTSVFLCIRLTPRPIRDDLILLDETLEASDSAPCMLI